MLILPPRTSWVYRFGLSISSTQRYLITLLFIIVCAALWFYYIYKPFNTRIENAKKQITMPQDVSAEELTENIAKLRNELSQSTALSSDDLLHLVLGYVDRAGLTLEQCSIEDKTIFIQALGTYAQCLSFFDQLASYTIAVVPRDIRIARGADGFFAVSVSLDQA